MEITFLLLPEELHRLLPPIATLQDREILNKMWTFESNDHRPYRNKTERINEILATDSNLQKCFLGSSLQWELESIFPHFKVSQNDLTLPECKSPYFLKQIAVCFDQFYMGNIFLELKRITDDAHTKYQPRPPTIIIPDAKNSSLLNEYILPWKDWKQHIEAKIRQFGFTMEYLNQEITPIY